MLPRNVYTMSFPEPLGDSQGVMRLHNKAAKAAMEQQLIEHHRKRIPGHFEATARTKYGYMQRKEGYKRWKLRKYKSRTDLVATGRTRDAMRKMYQIRIGGTASGETGLRGQLIMRFPFTGDAAFKNWQQTKAGKKKHLANVAARKAQVTIEQMRNEIATVLPNEQQEISQGLGDGYTRVVNTELATRPRMRKHFR